MPDKNNHPGEQLTALIALCAAALISSDDPSSGAFECAWSDLPGELKRLIEEVAGYSVSGAEYEEKPDCAKQSELMHSALLKIAAITTESESMPDDVAAEIQGIVRAALENKQ